jgi:hypothetical protein
MARARKDLLSRLADAGEDAVSRLGHAPGMEQMVGFANSTRDRLDELTKRVRGVDELEKRVKRLEKRLDEMSGTKSRATRSRTTSSAKKSTAGKTGNARKGSTAETGGKSPG